jgi:CO/xanthine dehydrogenase Mo-binding subunit
MIPFDLAEPSSLLAAARLLDPDDPTVRPIAGGTALMLMMKAGVFHPQRLISLRKIEPAYSDIKVGEDGLHIGAMTTLPAQTVRVVERDTDATPYDMGTLGSRSLFHMGHAIQRAAEEVRTKIAALRQEVGEPEGSSAPLSELFRKRFGMQAGNIIGSGAFKPEYQSPSRDTGQSPNVTPFWLLSAAGAEVEVDTETGHVRVAKLVSVADAGKAINPKIVETQISGGALMQLGFTLFEKIHIDGGQITNASLADYKIAGMHDLPGSMENLYIEHEQSNGPFGAKGVGESSMFCISPAVANAVDDAVGIRLTELPLNPEAVLRAIKANAGTPLEDE